MQKLAWLFLGVVAGFVLAHFANRSSSGQRFFETVDRGAREFSNAVVKGYQSREAEFTSTMHDVENAIHKINQS